MTVIVWMRNEGYLAVVGHVAAGVHMEPVRPGGQTKHLGGEGEDCSEHNSMMGSRP